MCRQIGKRAATCITRRRPRVTEAAYAHNRAAISLRRSGSRAHIRGILQHDGRLQQPWITRLKHRGVILTGKRTAWRQLQSNAQRTASPAHWSLRIDDSPPPTDAPPTDALPTDALPISHLPVTIIH